MTESCYSFIMRHDICKIKHGTLFYIFNSFILTLLAIFNTYYIKKKPISKNTINNSNSMHCLTKSQLLKKC